MYVKTHYDYIRVEEIDLKDHRKLLQIDSCWLTDHWQVIDRSQQTMTCDFTFCKWIHEFNWLNSRVSVREFTGFCEQIWCVDTCLPWNHEFFTWWHIPVKLYQFWPSMTHIKLVQNLWQQTEHVYSHEYTWKHVVVERYQLWTSMTRANWFRNGSLFAGMIDRWTVNWPLSGRWPSSSLHPLLPWHRRRRNPPLGHSLCAEMCETWASACARACPQCSGWRWLSASSHLLSHCRTLCDTGKEILNTHVHTC